MRILQLNSARKYVGEAAHTLNLTEALRRHGHQVWLGLRENFETIARARARKLDPLPFHMRHGWLLPHNIPDIRAIAHIVRDNEIEVIHAHRGKDHWLAVLAANMFRLKAPIVRTRHVVTPLSSNAANRWLARRTAALIAVSSAVDADVRRSGIFADERIAFIPGGIDLELFSPAPESARREARAKLDLDENDRVAICVARFANVKAHSVLLQAWKLVRDRSKDARLVLVGDGLLYDESKALAARLELGGSVIFLGRRDDVESILDAADAGVLSSIGSEGFSRAVLEYMAKGLPVVATRVGAVPDLISDGVHGALVEPNDAQTLAAGLDAVLNATHQQRQGWGRVNRAKAEKSYGYAGWALAHENLFVKVR